MWNSFVKKLANNWLAYNLAKLYNCRPSDLYAIDDKYVALCFDQAVGHVGMTIQNELDAVEGKKAAEIKAKQQIILDGYFGIEPGSVKGRFADPAAMFM